VFRPSLILTLSKFLDSLDAGLQPVSDPVLHLLVEDVLQDLRPAEFAKVADLPGFRDSVVALISEISAAGGDSARLEAVLRNQEDGFAAAFVSVFRAVEQELERRGLGLRGLRLTRLAKAVEENPPVGLTHIYLDGFLSFTAPELEVLRALSRRSDITATLPEWAGSVFAREKLQLSGFMEHRLEPRPHRPRVVLCAAPNRELEVEEIARRILTAGRPFREIGVILRQPRAYLASLRAAFERFGIPARYYFAPACATHPAVRYLIAIVEAMNAGWEHERALEALMMNASGVGATPAGDRFDFLVREALPGRGLGALRQHAAKITDARLHTLLDTLDQMNERLSGMATAADWSERITLLRGLVASRTPSPDGSHEQALSGRSQALALDAFDEAVREAVVALGADTLLTFADFWRRVRTVLELTPLRVPDHRHNVVHVLDAYEARQWRLPVVFVCGLLEGEFPAYPAQDPLLPDAARARLAAAGVPVKTIAIRQQEEDFLWQIARTRAEVQLTLTYPRFDDAGEELLRSFYLAEIEAELEDAQPARPASASNRAVTRQAAIYSEELQAQIAQLHSRWRPTAIESFLQCPFQFFARHTLRLAGRPKKPEERLDRLAQGTLVHRVLAEWHRTPRPIQEVFQTEFERFCEQNRVRQGYASEVVRLEMIRNLVSFAAQPRLEPGWRVEVEKEFQIELDEGVVVSGRIDRCDISPDGRSARVYDYKYSSATGLKKRVEEDAAERFVQGGLYMLALRPDYEVNSFHYCGLRGEVTWEGVEHPEEIDALTRQARKLTMRAAAEVRGGVIRVQPSNEQACGYCDYRDCCRVRSQAAVISAGGGE